MDQPTPDAVLVLRLWIEPHDGRVRARLLSPRAAEGIVTVDLDGILDAIRKEVEAFVLGAAPVLPAGRDATATRPEHFE